MNVLNRTQALRGGLQRYFTGKPCPHGHVAERYVKTWQCVECVSAYASWWATQNPEESKAINEAYRKRNPKLVKAWKSASQKRNRASANARQARYVEANKESVYARTEAWAKSNPAKGAAKTRRRQAAALQRTPAWADQDAILGMYELAQIFRNVGLEIEVDHEIPLRGKNVSGLHVHDNLRLIHPIANRIKSNHFQGA